VSEVARRHGISPQHLFVWRKAARAGLLSLPVDEAPLFVPVVTEPAPLGRPWKRRHGARQRSPSRLAMRWFARRPGSTRYGCAMCCGP
jgi:transposase-like protein